MPEPTIVCQEMIPPGCHLSLIVRRGYTLRLTDVAGGANIGMLLFNNDEKTERYNMADTLKAQHISRLTAGNVLYSDMGRVMMSITEDDCGWHDTICGTTDAAMITDQYGTRDFQDAHNNYYRNGKDGFLVELGRWGLTRRDLVANVNLFSKVSVDDDGAMQFARHHSVAGSSVSLRAELNVLIVLNSAPHPLREETDYPAGDVKLDVFWTGLAAADDLCLNSCEENKRGFANSSAWFAQQPGDLVQ